MIFSSYFQTRLSLQGMPYIGLKCKKDQAKVAFVMNINYSNAFAQILYSLLLCLLCYIYFIILAMIHKEIFEESYILRKIFTILHIGMSLHTLLSFYQNYKSLEIIIEELY